MKRLHLLTIFLMTLSCDPVPAPAQSVFTFSPDSYTGTDSQRVQRAVDLAIDVNGTVDLGTRLYKFDTGWVARRPGQYVTFHMKGSGLWNQCEFNGSGSWGHIVGGKRCSVSTVGTLLNKPGQWGLEIGTDDTVHSTSYTKLDRVFFQPRADGCTGFMLGTGPNGDDCAFITLNGCEVYYDSGDNSTPYLRWKSSVAAGNVGFAFVGSNHLADAMTDCTASGMLVAAKMINHLGYQSGASGLVVNNFGGSFNGVIVWCDGGSDLVWTGGRSEESGALLLHGDALNGGRQRARVTLRGCFLDDCFSKDGIPGLLAPGEVIGLHSASKYVFESVSLSHNYFGDDVGPQNVFLRCNDPTAKPSFSIDGSYFRNMVNGTWKEASLIVQPKQGTWARRVDGAALPSVTVN